MKRLLDKLIGNIAIIGALISFAPLAALPAYAASGIPPVPEIPDVVQNSLAPNGAAIEFAISADEVVTNQTTFGSPIPIAFLALSDNGNNKLEPGEDYNIFNYGVVAYDDSIPVRVVTSDLTGAASGSFNLDGLDNYATVSTDEVVLLGGSSDDRYILSSAGDSVRALNWEGHQVFLWGGAKDVLTAGEFRSIKIAYDAEMKSNYNNLINEQYGDEIPDGGVVGGVGGVQNDAASAIDEHSYQIALGATAAILTAAGLKKLRNSTAG